MCSWFYIFSSLNKYVSDAFVQLLTEWSSRLTDQRDHRLTDQGDDLESGRDDV